MGMRSVHAVHGLGGLDIAWLFEYHKYWLYPPQGRIRNPKADKITTYLLDLKSAENRNFQTAVAGFGKRLSKELKEWDVIDKTEAIVACIVPSSKVDRHSPGLVNILKYLERDDRRITASPKLLVRTNAIDKLASGGDRNINVHRQSIKISEKIRADRTYLVLDDITTTGNSLAACVELLSRAGARRVLAIALGKTHD